MFQYQNLIFCEYFDIYLQHLKILILSLQISDNPSPHDLRNSPFLPHSIFQEEYPKVLVFSLTRENNERGALDNC